MNGYPKLDILDCPLDLVWHRSGFKREHLSMSAQSGNSTDNEFHNLLTYIPFDEIS
jgi:hypothetical protein